MHKFRLPYNLQFFAAQDANGLTIFELVTSDELASYWETKEEETEDLLGDELFPSQQKQGLDLKWLKGAQGLPVVLKPSAYDVAALKRDRIGFDKVSAEMPFFKESTMIDEEMRQQLNIVLETGNRVYIDSIMRRVFDDEIRLLRGAKAQRERMKMMLLTTGMISISANGQDYDYDYGMRPEQKKEVKIPWSDPSATIVDDIREWQDEIEEETGVRPDRAVVSSRTMAYFTRNTEIRNAIWGNNSAAPVKRAKAIEYLEAELGIKIKPYTKKYIDEHNKKCQYIPDDLFTMFPSGELGTGWFGTTPEQSDLMAGTAANVSIVDTGVAITTVKKTDPVNVDTKVSMIFLPSFESIDQVIIADLSGGKEDESGGKEDESGEA